MKNISFIRASKNIKYYKESTKENAQNPYLKNKKFLRDVKEFNK